MDNKRQLEVSIISNALKEVPRFMLALKKNTQEIVYTISELIKNPDQQSIDYYKKLQTIDLKQGYIDAFYRNQFQKDLEEDESNRPLIKLAHLMGMTFSQLIAMIEHTDRYIDENQKLLELHLKDTNEVRNGSKELKKLLMDIYNDTINHQYSSLN